MGSKNRRKRIVTISETPRLSDQKWNLNENKPEGSRKHAVTYNTSYICRPEYNISQVIANDMRLRSHISRCHGRSSCATKDSESRGVRSTDPGVRSIHDKA